eukprot:3332237-Pyramimonas_sp.AAC.1
MVIEYVINFWLSLPCTRKSWERASGFSASGKFRADMCPFYPPLAATRHAKVVHHAVRLVELSQILPILARPLEQLQGRGRHLAEDLLSSRWADEGARQGEKTKGRTKSDGEYDGTAAMNTIGHLTS